MSDVSTRLDKIIGEFADLDAREKLELLVDFANGLPPLPPEYEGKKGTARIHECQTPVFLWMEADDRGSRLVAEVAPEAPTVKGFVAILAEAVAGRPRRQPRCPKTCSSGWGWPMCSASCAPADCDRSSPA
jgi:cysteine desulfuration protein SufE